MPVNEHHIYGPPGTGKTTTAAKNIAKAAQKYGSDNVLVCSFTRAAATEIADRGIPVDKAHVGTLHSICYRALGNPELAEKHIDDFNSQHPAYAVSALKTSLDDYGEVSEGKNPGDSSMVQYQLLRARMVDREVWPIPVKDFAEKWEDWKTTSGAFDFTDLITIALMEMAVAPGYPAVAFVDEAQDLNALQYALIRKWAKSMDFVVFLGDDDQAIYQFAGADAGNLLDQDIPDKNKIILSQSYRLSRAVHGFSTNWIESCSTRQPKAFKPTDQEGAVRRIGHGSWRFPDPIVDDIEANLENGTTIMLLASCSYMLGPTIALLRERALPFHNPYRRNRGDWNPLSRASGSAANRLRQFMRTDSTGLGSEWTANSLKMWTDMIYGKGVLKHGAKKIISDMAEARPGLIMEIWELQKLFEPSFFMDVMTPTPEWLVEHAKEEKKRPLELAARIWNRWGAAGYDEPRITLGTIHSVKGGEADIVYLFPDLSFQADRQWDAGGKTRDDVRRVFYVGMTRARQELVLLPYLSPLKVDL